MAAAKRAFDGLNLFDLCAPQCTTHREMCQPARGPLGRLFVPTRVPMSSVHSTSIATVWTRAVRIPNGGGGGGSQTMYSPCGRG